MGGRVRAWSWRVSLRLLTAAALGVLLLAAMPVRAQEMDCDTDPLIFVDAGDGRMFVLHQWYKAPMKLPNGQVVSHAEMTRHLETSSSYQVMSVVKANGSYKITIQSHMQPYLGQHFQYKTWLKDDATNAQSATVSASTGQWVTSTISISEAKINATENPPKTQLGESLCSAVVTGVHHKNVIVPADQSCQIQGAIIYGNVIVSAGAKLRMFKAKVTGNVIANDAQRVQLNFPNGNAMTALEIHGNVILSNARSTSPKEPNAICDRVMVKGNVQLINGAGTTNIGDFGSCKSGNMIDGSIQVINNIAPVGIADNTVKGNLDCWGNLPSPSSFGLPNQVNGNRTGQCANLQ